MTVLVCEYPIAVSAEKRCFLSIAVSMTDAMTKSTVDTTFTNVYQRLPSPLVMIGNRWKMTEKDGKIAMNRNDFNAFSAPSPKTILMGSSFTTSVTTRCFTSFTTLYHFKWQPTVSRLRCLLGALPPLKSLVTV